jgi:hypothetical protein
MSASTSLSHARAGTGGGGEHASVGEWGGVQMMTLCGDADGMVSGATHTTAATIRPGLQVLRTPDSPLVSSVFFMCLPDKVRRPGDSPAPCMMDEAPVAPPSQTSGHPLHTVCHGPATSWLSLWYNTHYPSYLFRL